MFLKTDAVTLFHNSRSSIWSQITVRL